jgi:hypothetical protein
MANGPGYGKIRELSKKVKGIIDEKQILKISEEEMIAKLVDICSSEENRRRILRLNSYAGTFQTELGKERLAYFDSLKDKIFV